MGTPYVGADGLSHRNVKAALVDFILNEAASTLPHIVEYFGKNPLQSVVAHRTELGAQWILNGLVAVVA